MSTRARTTTAKKPRAKREAPSHKEATPKSARAPRAARAPQAAAGGKRVKAAEKPRESPSVRAIKAAMAAAPSEGGPDEARMKDFDWDDGEAPVAEPTELYNRWSERGDALTLRLAELGVDERLYEVDLRAGRITWLDADGGPICEARAQLLCCHVPTARKLVMAWADPILSSLAADPPEGARAEDGSGERDDLDDLGAWVAAMRSAEACGAEYLYRVPGALASHFLALRNLRGGVEGAVPEADGSPVSLVRARLDEARRALEPSAVRADEARDRLSRAGADVTRQSETTYRDTEWTGRLARTGRHLLQLAARLARPTYTAIARGKVCEELVDMDVAEDLRRSVELLADEWAAFA